MIETGRAFGGRRILVTGGAGFVGSALTRRLVEAGARVTVLDDLFTGVADALPTGAELVVGSVTDRDLVERLGAQGFPPERIGLLGFSQGACLSTEFAARNARRYGCVVALSGGLIGPAGTPRDYAGSLGGTPVFLGCSDIDPHIPLERVQETAAVLRALGAEVDERIYPGMGHVVNDDDIAAVRALLEVLTGKPA